jgi:hypothetical protein
MVADMIGVAIIALPVIALIAAIWSGNVWGILAAGICAALSFAFWAVAVLLAYVGGAHHKLVTTRGNPDST